MRPISSHVLLTKLRRLSGRRRNGPVSTAKSLIVTARLAEKPSHALRMRYLHARTAALRNVGSSILGEKIGYSLEMSRREGTLITSLKDSRRLLSHTT